MYHVAIGPTVFTTTNRSTSPHARAFLYALLMIACLLVPLCIQAQTVPTGPHPTAVAVNTVTNKIYVANFTGNSVTVIDGATNTTATVPAGALPFALAVNEVTNKIYIVNQSSNDVTIIDGATNNATSVTIGPFPNAVAVNSVTNKVYVTDF